MRWLRLTSRLTDKERYVLASHLAVLRGCPEAISRLMKGGGSLLQAAKILVISRLLHKKLSHRTDPPPYLEILRNRLAVQRRKLLARVDRRFKSLDASDFALVEAMCAFSLATSSSATDVLRHLHRVRQSIMLELGKEEDSGGGIFKSLRFFIKTVRDCQVLVPSQLARAMEGLKATPLLQDPDLRLLMELNLDIHQRWLGEEINSFIPYIRHDDLQKPDATRLLKQWAKSAFSTFRENLRDIIGKISDPAVLADLRQEMLELWFSKQGQSIGTDTSEVLEGIRDAFNNRFQVLVHQHCSSLSNVASTIESLLEHWETGVSDACPSLWDNAITTMDVKSGIKTLRETLSISFSGKSQPVRAAFMAYAKWLDGTRDLESTIQTLREKRWADDLDDIDEEDDLLENKQILLSEDDPRLLQDTLQNDIQQNFYLLQIKMHALTDDLRVAFEDDNDGTTAHRACFLLRVWREITHQLPSSYPNPDRDTAFVRTLQSQVSMHVLRQPLLRLDKRASKSLGQTGPQARVLWEGDPQLPVLPSPYAFRLLLDIVRAMAGFGADLWNPLAVAILKRRLRDGLAPLMGNLPEARGRSNGHVSTATESEDGDVDLAEEGTDPRGSSEQQDGEAEDDEMRNDEQQDRIQGTNGSGSNEREGPSEDVAREMRIQRLFDVHYFQQATSIGDADADDALHRIESAIEKGLELPSADVKRMRKGAEAYWKRTELLFALLA